MNDGFISIFIFWGQGFMVKHWRTPFLWDFIHALSIAQLTDGVQHSLIPLEAMTDCSLPLDLRHYPKSHLCFTSLSQDFEFRDQQNPFVFFANWLALPSINHRNHAVLIWTGEASIASPDSTHRFLSDPYSGHGDWINVFPSKFSIAIVMFWFSWKFLFGHNNNVQILYFHR